MNTTNIDKLIAEKSSTQAEAEWNKLILGMFEFFKNNPAGKNEDGPFTCSYNVLMSKPSGYFDKKNEVTFIEFHKLLLNFGVAWREERKCRIIEIKTKELLERVSIM